MKQQEYYFEIEDNASSEVIVWNKYPNEKPECKSHCLVCTLNADIPVIVWWDGHFFYGLGYPDAKRFNKVYAWAELPKGWKEEQE